MMRAPLLPRGPVLEAGALGADAAGLPGVEDLPQRLLTTSGRAALYQALQQAALPPASAVLVPTYHCPTMIAPVCLAGHRPVFYGIDGDGLPLLEGIDPSTPARAMIVAHCFGLPRSLAAVRAWCDTRGLVLIEDCAHALWGQAGERAVGQWGDWATASLTKFLPVPEAGLLASARHALKPVRLQPQGARAQLKGVVDLLDRAVQSGRLAALRPVLAALAPLRRAARGTPSATDAADDDMQASPHDQAHDAADAAARQAPSTPDDEAAAVARCEMARVGAAPLAIVRWLVPRLARQRIVQRRQRHHARLHAALAGLAGARPLHPEGAPPSAAPYAFALRVDDAERVYQGLRAQALPVFRWDRRWPGTPQLPGDHAPDWQHHVLQFMCHQSLRDDEVDRMVDATRRLLAAGRR